MKIRLIDPAYREESYLIQDKKDIKNYWFARLSLTTLAALTPKGVEVAITDENVDEIDFDEDVDLVGITAMTMHAKRAYEIARRFRERGVTVVMGGIHASSLPQEAKRYVDAVVIGEAEEVWSQLIEDFKAGELKPFYKAKKLCNFRGMPIPRRDLLKKERYSNVNTLQATRGCPFRCEFCAVTQFFGHTYRCRPVDEVIKEVEGLDEGVVTFVDDNIVGNPKYAKELFRRLIPLNIKWGGQSSLTIANDEELLKLAVKSGCYALFFGIETLSQRNLQAVHKVQNKADKLEDTIKKIHDHGISMIGSFIFGLDYDDEGVFERTVRFCEKNHIELPVYFILTPIPGTPLFHRFEKEGRIIHKRWEKYNAANVVFRPKFMSAEALQDGFWWAFRETYSHISILKRILFSPMRRFVPNFLLNYAFRRLCYRGPKGQISIYAKLVDKLNFSLPLKDARGLIPVIRETSSEIKTKAKRFFRMETFKDTYLETLFIKVEGAMDKKVTKRFLERISKVIKKGHERIVVDFKELCLISPEALKLLHNWYDKIVTYTDRINLIDFEILQRIKD